MRDYNLRALLNPMCTGKDVVLRVEGFPDGRGVLEKFDFPLSSFSEQVGEPNFLLTSEDLNKSIMRIRKMLRIARRKLEANGIPAEFSKEDWDNAGFDDDELEKVYRKSYRKTCYIKKQSMFGWIKDKILKFLGKK